MMLSALHQSLTRLLYERGQIDPSAVEVSFEQPTRQWAEDRLRPALNFFLYDLDEHTDLRNSTAQTTRVSGRALQRMPPRRINLRYLVSAWSSDPADEHALLWRTLAVLMRHTPLPVELLGGELRAAGLPLPAHVGRPAEAPASHDLWGALSLPPRPALTYTVIAPLDLEVSLDAPLVLQSSLRFLQPLGAEPTGDPYDRSLRQIGGVVRDSAGAPLAGALVALEGSAEEATTDDAGRYTLTIRQAGPLRLRVQAGDRSRSLSFDESPPSYDIALE